MKILNTIQKENAIEVEIEIEQSVWKKAQQTAKQKLLKTIKVDGFRNGKIPKNLEDKHVPKMKIMIEASEQVFDEGIRSVIYSQEFLKLKAIPMPSKSAVKEISENKLTFVVTFNTLPVATKLDIAKINIPKLNKIDDKEKMIEFEISNLLNKQSEKKIKNGPISNGDIATIDFKGYIDNVAFEGGEGHDYPLAIGSHSFIDNFEEQLIGMNVNDKKDIFVTFPSNYHDTSKSGKKSKFEVKIKKVEEQIKPKIDKELLDKLGFKNLKNETELNTYLSNLIDEEHELKNNNIIYQAIKDAIIKHCKLSYIPENWVASNKKEICEYYEANAKKHGLDLEQFKKINKVSDKEFDEELSKKAFENILISVALDQMIEEYKIELSKQDIDTFVEKIAKLTGSSVEEAKKLFLQKENYYEAIMLENKLIKIISEKIKK